MILTPQGKLSHYFFSTDISPADLSAALHDAAANRGSTVDSPEQQACVTYDALQSTRGWVIRVVQIFGALWAALLFTYIGRKVAADLRGRRAVSPQILPSWGANHE